MFAALQTIPLHNNAQYCRKKVQGHCQNNPNFPSRNKISRPPTILNPKKTASWQTAERQMTTRKVCCGPRKAAAGEARKPGKTQTTCATGKGKQRRGNRGRRHTAVTPCRIGHKNSKYVDRYNRTYRQVHIPEYKKISDT
jgi:hypothetical protein